MNELNAIIIVKDGKQKSIVLPEHGEITIKINQGMPVQVNQSTKHRFEEIK